MKSEKVEGILWCNKEFMVGGGGWEEGPSRKLCWIAVGSGKDNDGVGGGESLRKEGGEGKQVLFLGKGMSLRLRGR
jgi:hypothetical protein